MVALAEQSGNAAQHAAGDAAVVCRGVAKTYGEGSAAVHALRGVDLTVARGELLMMVGPSGCGKTTLISVIAGILDRDAGECTVFGQDFSAMRGEARTKLRGRTLGFVFQAFNLLPSLTAAQNVAVPLMLLGERRGKAEARGKELLSRVGLGDKVNKKPSELSGGQQQRVAIARALVHDPRLVVCDEPTSALDHETGHNVMELLKEIATGKDRALIVVTHDARIFPFADRIARMDDGRVTSIDAPPREFAQHGVSK
jgi:putative ABC transport system ATP-binding protein